MSLRTQVAKYERKAVTAKPADEIEKIKLWYMQQDTHLLPHDEPIQLTTEQEAKRDRLREVWKLLVSTSKQAVIEYCESEYGVSHRQAWNYVSQAQKLFGSIDQADKKADRALLIAKREAIIDIIKRDDEMDARDKYALIDKFMEAIEKMKDAYKPGELTTEEILDKLQLPNVTISSNPEILNG